MKRGPTGPAPSRRQPRLHILAGVNGAGKSSLGGQLLRDEALTWFNPDTFARDLIHATECDLQTANAAAWHEGVRLLDHALAHHVSYAFETTLGGNTIAKMIRRACDTHDVRIWFCALDSPERHIARVKLRVARGGHDIPESRIRERYPRSLQNLIQLLPHLSALRAYDNSLDVPAGVAVPDPVLALEILERRVTYHAADDIEALTRTPDWAKPVVEAALQLFS